ncbi:hypothetical protein ES708_05941 [subsurface metagenome]
MTLVAFSQANKGNGSKGVIIGALVVSIIAISVGIIQIFLIGTIAYKGGQIKNMIEDGSIKNKIEKIAKEFEDEFEGEYGKDFEEAMEDVGKSIEKIGDDLEETMEKLEEDDELSDDEKAAKLGKAAGKAMKEFVKELEDTTDTK